MAVTEKDRTRSPSAVGPETRRQLAEALVRYAADLNEAFYSADSERAFRAHEEATRLHGALRTIEGIAMANPRKRSR